MRKTIIVLGLVLFSGFVLTADFVDFDLKDFVKIEPEKVIEPVEFETKEIITLKTSGLIESVDEVKDYYTDSKELEEPIKIEVETFKDTDVVFIHTYYSNGKHAVTISTKQAIELKEETKPIDTKT